MFWASTPSTLLSSMASDCPIRLIAQSEGGVRHFVRWDRVRRVSCGCVAAAVLLAGCADYSRLPTIHVDRLGQQSRTIPADAAPLYSWSASRAGLKTYWGHQSVSIHAVAFVPDTWTNAGDEFWKVETWNSEGKTIPFIGVVRRYLNEQGTELSVVVPPLDLDKAPDGLYLVIDPNITVKDCKVQSIQPIALLTEIRHHAFKPFQVRIPLVPEQESPVTPKPPSIPEPPPGTPIPVD